MNIPAVLMRGGTSKGIFLHQSDLPPAGPALDALLLRLMGSPDPMQIDGLGGSHSSTSKVIIVAASDQPDVDVDYWFAQVPVGAGPVLWSGNCGNLTTAVGPFAIDEGLVPVEGVLANVRLRNRNTGVVVHAQIPVMGGRAQYEGSFVVPGVPGVGAPIVTNYRDPAGGTLGGLFPSGARVDRIPFEGATVDVSILDVTHPFAFVRAGALGLDLRSGGMADDDLDPHLERLERLRAACATLVGGGAAAVPRLMIVDEATPADGASIRAVALSMGRRHHALPMTGALCLAAASRIGGTVPAAIVGGDLDAALRVRHPKGVVEVTVELSDDGDHQVRSVGVVRTARRLMSGTAHVSDRDHAPVEAERPEAVSTTIQ